MFKPEELNKAYYDLSILTKSQEKPITILYGGRNSSKTYSCQQWLVKKLWNEPEANAIWYRNESSVLKTKAFYPIKDLLTKHGLDRYVSLNYSNQSKEITFPSGNKLYFDFCDGGKSKGMANVRYVIVDEIDQLSRHDFMLILSSYRGDPKIRFIFMFNPVSDRHWLKSTFFDIPETEEARASSLYSLTNRMKYTIEDNKFATEMDYRILDSFKFTDENEYRIARLGEWGTIKVENPFYQMFNYGTHTAVDVPLFDEYPIYLTFDFGKKDTCIVGQHFQDYEIGSDPKLLRYFKDSVAANTVIRNYQEPDIRIIVHKIISEFGIDREYYVYGDTSGGSDEWSKFAEIRNYMEDAGCYLLSFPRRIKLRHRSSGAITNWCFSMYNSNIKLDKHHAKELIDDLMAVKKDDFGNIDKNYAVKFNVSHFSDCWRYMNILTDGENFIRNNAYFAQKELGSDIGQIEGGF